MLPFNRRDFLKVSASPLLAGTSLKASAPRVNCIFLMLVGGPSQLDTWDPKPDAPSQIRGPYKPIPTNVPGIQISEIFPRMARHADKYALLRGCYHQGEPVHDIGHQLMQTGRVCKDDVEHPHIGCVVSSLESTSSHVLLPGPIGRTGGNMPHGQTAAFLGVEHAPCRRPLDLQNEPNSTRDKYGRNGFGQNCLCARRLIESGVRFVTINMFETVFNEITWDIHGSAPFSPMSCYRDRVGPMFDRAYSALLEDLSDRGLLASTLVVATGEFGRTPKINPAGGRDHWPGCWTSVMAGGGIIGGQIIGSSDSIAAEPRDRPVSPAEFLATIYHALGIDYALNLPSSHIPLVEPGARPVLELFGSPQSSSRCCSQVHPPKAARPASTMTSCPYSSNTASAVIRPACVWAALNAIPTKASCAGLHTAPS